MRSPNQPDEVIIVTAPVPGRCLPHIATGQNLPGVYDYPGGYLPERKINWQVIAGAVLMAGGAVLIAL